MLLLTYKATVRVFQQMEKIRDTWFDVYLTCWTKYSFWRFFFLAKTKTLTINQGLKGEGEGKGCSKVGGRGFLEPQSPDCFAMEPFHCLELWPFLPGSLKQMLWSPGGPKINTGALGPWSPALLGPEAWSPKPSWGPHKLWSPAEQKTSKQTRKLLRVQRMTRRLNFLQKFK